MPEIHMFKNKRFEIYLLKNRITGLALSLVIAAAFILMAFHVELADRLVAKTYHSMDEIESANETGDADVTITIDRADYMGYDSYDGATRQGSYYYCEENGRFAVLLLESDEDVLLGYTVRGRVLQADEDYEQIASQLAKDIGLTAGQLEKSMYSFVISEIDFPRMYYIVLLAALIGAVLLLAWNIVGCVRCMLCPWKQVQVRTLLGNDADPGRIKDIDSQLRYNVRFDREGVTVTDSYFLYHSIRHTDVVMLDRIEAYRKLRTSPNIGPDRKVYKLLMTDVDGVTYEQNFKTEQALDEALSCLKTSAR